jgi:methylthioribose-1-phosphate isomerase
MIVEAVKWIGETDGYLELIDQRRLPLEFVKLQCRDVETLFGRLKHSLFEARPSVSAAYGLVLALQKLEANESIGKSLEELKSS